MITRIILINLILASSNASRYGRSVIKNRIQPNSEHEMIWPGFEPEIPDHCRGQGLCEDVPNYPHEYIDRLLRNNATVRNALSFILGSYESPRGCADGQDPKKDELCASKTEVYQAKAVQDTSGSWYYLLPEQFLCLEICKNDGGPCSNRAMVVFTGYTATCRQKYTRKRMITVDKNGAMKYIDVDTILSGCCCQVTEDSDI